jgi:hypothetical protein
MKLTVIKYKRTCIQPIFGEAQEAPDFKKLKI